MTALFLLDALRTLGLGQSILVAAVLFIGVVYLWRGRKWGQVVVGIVGTVWLVTIAAILAVGFAVALGWVDPNPGAFMHDVGAAAGWLWGAVRNLVLDRVSGALAASSTVVGRLVGIRCVRCYVEGTAGCPNCQGVSRDALDNGVRPT